jgi:hypothetical protein
LQYLQSNPTQVLVCNSCRKRFTDFRSTRVVDNFGEQEYGKKLRSSVDTVFAWKAVRVLCCETIDDEEQHHKVQTLELQQTLLKHCKLRGEDAWSVEANGGDWLAVRQPLVPYAATKVRLYQRRARISREAYLSPLLIWED